MTNHTSALKNTCLLPYYRSETKALEDINLDIEQGSLV